MTEPLVAALLEAQTAMEAGRLREAIGAFQAAQRLSPTDTSVALALANAQRLADDVVGARATLLEAFRRGTAADPAVTYALGAALLDVGAPREAAGCFTRVIRARPDDPAPLAALAGARRAAGDPAAAWLLIEQSVTASPRNAPFLLTAAQIRHELGDLEGARHWLARAEAVRPGHALTQLQRAYTALLAGPSRAAWELFESRPLPVPSTSARAWHGEPLADASVLVTAEQGIGDQFQFVRFVPALAALGARRVIVECHADVVSLFVANGMEAVARGSHVETDWHVPLMSLPHRLQCDTAVGGERVPYLRAPSDESELTALSAPQTGRRRLGLVWAGNPAFTGRITRDLDVACLPDILAIPDVDWISLQHGEAGAAAPEALQRITLPRTWAETAALLRDLDGLVTTDTGIAHLAGAMGVRTWVMLQHVPDWRWGLHGETCAWYPTLRLLRQARPREWSTVVAALRAALVDVAL